MVDRINGISEEIRRFAQDVNRYTRSRGAEHQDANDLSNHYRIHANELGQFLSSTVAELATPR